MGDFFSLFGTQGIAVWGAITGTIGMIAGVLNLWLRYQQQTQGQAKLICESAFDYEVSNGTPTPKYKIVVRSVGRRPVVLDGIEYFYNPRTFWSRLRRQSLWKQGKWVLKDDLGRQGAVTLTEGQKAVFFIDKNRFERLHEVGSVKVHDQTGRRWSVEWPESKQIGIELSYGEIIRFVETGERRTITVVGNSIKNGFNIFTQWNLNPPSKSTLASRYFHFERRSDYEKKLADIRTNQIPKLINDTIDGIT